MNHSHQLLQRLRLELAHGEDPLVQPRAGSCPQGFLEESTKSGLSSHVQPGVTKHYFRASGFSGIQTQALLIITHNTFIEVEAVMARGVFVSDDAKWSYKSNEVR